MSILWETSALILNKDLCRHFVFTAVLLAVVFQQEMTHYSHRSWTRGRANFDWCHSINVKFILHWNSTECNAFCNLNHKVLHVQRPRGRGGGGGGGGGAPPQKNGRGRAQNWKKKIRGPPPPPWLSTHLEKAPTSSPKFEINTPGTNSRTYCTCASHQLELIPVSIAYISTYPLDEMLVHHRVTLSIKFTSTHLYTWVERGTVRVKCLAQEQNTMSPARAETGPLDPESSVLNVRPPHLHPG